MVARCAGEAQSVGRSGLLREEKLGDQITPAGLPGR